MGVVDTTEAFDILLATARKHGVEEFTLGDLAVKFARVPGPVVEEREKKEPEGPPNALDMLNKTLPGGSDTFMMPGDKPADAAPTSVGWATEDPKTE